MRLGGGAESPNPLIIRLVPLATSSHPEAIRVPPRITSLASTQVRCCLWVTTDAPLTPNIQEILRALGVLCQKPGTKYIFITPQYHRIPSSFLAINWQVNPKICVKMQGTHNHQINLKKEKQSWRTQTFQFQRLLHNYSNQDRMVLA